MQAGDSLRVLTAKRWLMQSFLRCIAIACISALMLSDVGSEGVESRNRGPIQEPYRPPRYHFRDLKIVPRISVPALQPGERARFMVALRSVLRRDPGRDTTEVWENPAKSKSVAIVASRQWSAEIYLTDPAIRRAAEREATEAYGRPADAKTRDQLLLNLALATPCRRVEMTMFTSRNASTSKSASLLCRTKDDQWEPAVTLDPATP